MSQVVLWSLFCGIVFLLAALGRGPLKRWPVSMTTAYLLAGIAIGPWGLSMVDWGVVQNTKLVETLAEIAVVISLLTAGLRLDISKPTFRIAALPLATIGMALTIAAVAGFSCFAFDLTLGSAVLLGAVLAPTDPVLANDVQIRHRDDEDVIRNSLTGEAAINDGAAFPFVMLGLGLLGVHELGDYGWKWFSVDLVWAISAGLFCGWGVGFVTSRLAIWVKRNSDYPAACEELLTLALIGLSYGAAMAVNAYGFLAVFAAGFATRKYADADNHDDRPDKTMRTVAQVNEQFERIVEVVLVVLTGILIGTADVELRYCLIALFLFFIARPAAASLTLLKLKASWTQKAIISFFGIRGIGSLYYLGYAVDHGLPTLVAEKLSGIVIVTVAISILLHSNTASLAMYLYSRSSGSDDE